MRLIQYHLVGFLHACYLLQAKNNIATMHAQRGEACKIDLTKVLPCTCHAVETGRSLPLKDAVITVAPLVPLRFPTVAG